MLLQVFVRFSYNIINIYIQIEHFVQFLAQNSIVFRSYKHFFRIGGLRGRGGLAEAQGSPQRVFI